MFKSFFLESLLTTYTTKREREFIGGPVLYHKIDGLYPRAPLGLNSRYRHIHSPNTRGKERKKRLQLGIYEKIRLSYTKILAVFIPLFRSYGTRVF